MAEQQKKPAAQQKKRPRLSSGGIKLSSLAAAAPSPAATTTPTLAVTSPVAATATAALAAPSPAATRVTPAAALTGPSPVAKAKPTATVAVTGSVGATAPAALAAPSQAATRTTSALKAPSPKATAQPIAVAEPEYGGVLEQGGGAMAAMAAQYKSDVLNLDLKKNLKWVQCAACSSALKPPVFMCENAHDVCSACGDGDAGENRHCGPCGRDVAFTHLPCMDGLVGALESPCPYKKFGCGKSVAYHELAEHKAACAHAPCYCLECTPPFEGSPASLVRHLTDKSGRHRWPASEIIKYGAEKWFVMRVSEWESDHRHLLVAEDGRVFLLAVDATCRPPESGLSVTVVCVSGNARPAYRGTLTVEGPWDEDDEDGHKDTFKLNAKIESCAVPGDVDMEHGRLNAHVNRELLHGEGCLKVHLSICITKLP